MKKLLLLITALCSMMNAQAILGVEEICGTWTTSGSYLFDSAFDGTFASPTTITGTCTISKVDDATVTLTNLLGDDGVTMTGTVDYATSTISIAPATVYEYYTFAGAVSESADIASTTPVTAQINEDGTITISNFVLDAYGTSYSKDGQITLSGHEGGGQAAEAKLLWTRNGEAWDSKSESLGKVTVNAYSDGSYKVTAWQGTEGYDLKFKVNENSEIEILNAYDQNGGYSYVMGGASENDPIYYAGLYTSSKYSAVFDPEWENKVTTLDPEGGYLYAYCYAYNYSDKSVYSGYYYVTWGPEYTITVRPSRNNYNQNYQLQNSQIDLLKQDSFEATLKVYDNGLYLIKNWEGVAGYDLKFQLVGESDSLTVLNEDAEEVVTSKGTRYWRVPTGRSDYDRACVYQDSQTYNEFHMAPERASITFGCSYIYPTGSNKGTKAYYCIKGYNENDCDTVAVGEYTYDYENGMYVDTISCNINKLDSVVIYTLEREDSTIYYCIPDFLGTATGDLLFELNEEDQTATNISIEGPVLNSLYYYYIHTPYDNATEAADNLVPGYYYTCLSKDATTDEASLIIDMYYTAAGATDGVDTYYCIDMTDVEAATAIATTTAIAPINASARTNSSVLYDLSGRKLNGTPVKGLYIQNGKKYVK